MTGLRRASHASFRPTLLARADEVIK